MSSKISSSELKQNTRQVLNTVIDNPDEPVLVYTYNEPKVVIISYKVWKDSTTTSGKPSIKELKKYFGRTEQSINSTKEIRKLRNE